MNRKDLRPGNIVYIGNVGQYPVRILHVMPSKAIVDFLGNEKLDKLEVPVLELSPIKIKDWLLENMGFQLNGKIYTNPNSHAVIKIVEGVNGTQYEMLINGKEQKISDLHELQNLYFDVYKKPFLIEDRNIIAGICVIRPLPEINKRDLLDARYIRMAFIWAENSYAKRRQVGCLIVKNGMIISDGYNGTPSGFLNVCEDETNHTFPYVLHAEANAITKLAKHGNKSEGATIYITDEPCLECSKLIIQAGIKRAVYCREYRIHDGIELLNKAGIEVLHLEWEDAPVVPCP